jgi:hypothetical protein
MNTRKAHIHINGYAGHREIACLVVGETKTFYRVITEKDFMVNGRLKSAGQTHLVPKYAITFENS